jgi:cell division protein FtsW (lipid II flippase)
MNRLSARPIESFLLLIVAFLAFQGFLMAPVALQVRQGEAVWPVIPAAFLPPLVLAACFFLLHGLLLRRGLKGEQLILPLVALLVTIGCLMIWRLRPPAFLWQQITRGLLPGTLLLATFILWPGLVERVRRDWPITISLTGLLLLLATAFIGVQDETGARLAIQIGPLPPIQTSEIIKLCLIIFLAWYIESEGEAAHGRARTFLGVFRLPPVRYIVPGLLFAGMATLGLVRMADFGAILIVGPLFLGMLYAGFESRIFATISAIGLLFSTVVAVLLAFFWQAPAVIRHRWLAFWDPWSQEPLLVGGVDTGLTIAEGPGYQIQQAIYALLGGGLTGTGLGLGWPGFVPLAHSDFIFAPIMEELGLLGAVALLACFAVLLLRILRLAILLPAAQVFERLLLVGIAIHLAMQLFVMVGGTLNLLPMTGVTVPFLSQGGMALMVNLVEIGFVLALIQRVESGVDSGRLA